VQATHDNKGEYQSIIDRMLKPLLDRYKGAETRISACSHRLFQFYFAEKFEGDRLLLGSAWL
jgi:hypothetical protein